MVKNKQVIYNVNAEKAMEIIEYLGTHSSAYSGIFKFEDDGRIKIRPYKGKIEIRCDCKEEVINKLEEMIKK
jgi:hypothetical protein